MANDVDIMFVVIKATYEYHYICNINIVLSQILRTESGMVLKQQYIDNHLVFKH